MILYVFDEMKFRHLKVKEFTKSTRHLSHLPCQASLSSETLSRAPRGFASVSSQICGLKWVHFRLLFEPQT